MAGFEMLLIARKENEQAAERSSDQAERDREASQDRAKAGKTTGRGVREGLPRSLWLKLTG